MLKQKEACFQVITAMTEVVADVKTQLTREQIEECAHELCAMTHDGKVEVKSEQADLLKYWKTTVRNWLRRDERLNGGVKDEPKFKRGPKESKQIKATRSFIQQLEQDPEANADKIAHAQQVLAGLVAEAAKAKAKQAFNAEDLPAELQDLVSAS